MSSLTPEAQALLDAGRKALSPTSATKAKVLGAVESNIAVGAAASGGGGFVLGKLWLSVILAASIGGGAYWALEGRSAPNSKTQSPEFAEATSLPAKSPLLAPPDEPGAPMQPTAANTPAQEANMPAQEASAQPSARLSAEATSSVDEVREETRASTPRRAKPRKRPRSTPAKLPVQSLAEERELIASAQSAIRDGTYAKARTFLSAHKSKFADGMLAPERQAATAIVHCLEPTGTNGKAVARRFLASHPNSPLAGRVRSKCDL